MYLLAGKPSKSVSHLICLCLSSSHFSVSPHSEAPILFNLFVVFYSFLFILFCISLCTFSASLIVLPVSSHSNFRCSSFLDDFPRCIGDEGLEVINPTTGKTEKEEPSQLTKQAMFRNFLSLYGKITALDMSHGVLDAPK